jgi:hypothetical protein
MGVGIVGVVVSTVMACKATLKVEEVIDEAGDKINKIKATKGTYDESKYSEQDYRKDMALAYVQTGYDFLKLYGPAVAVGMVSISCLVGSHTIMLKRNATLLATYKVLEQSFNAYRKRVADEYGEKKDYQFKNGIHEETVTVVEEDEDGKKVKIKKTIEARDPNSYSIYARFYDKGCKEFTDNPEYNLTFLKAQQNYANDRLHSRGHLFLNEVYDMLGIPHSQAGSIVGWVNSKDGDNFVDFGIHDLYDSGTRDFVNGYEPVILLDFNVDGVIYNLI